MGKPNPHSRPLRIARLASQLFQEGKTPSFDVIKEFLQKDEIEPVIITKDNWTRFMKEIAGSYFYNTDGVLSLRTDVNVNDFQELVTELNRSTLSKGERQHPIVEGGFTRRRPSRMGRIRRS